MNKIKDKLTDLYINNKELTKEQMLTIIQDIIKETTTKTGGGCFPCICLSECSDNQCEFTTNVDISL